MGPLSLPFGAHRNEAIEMKTQTVKFIDQARNTIAIACVGIEGDQYGGTIDLHGMPANLRALFDELEQVVNGQMFSFLDEIQEKIGTLPIKVVLENGQEMFLNDLQVYPSTAEVSFKLAAVRAASMKSA
jgi:hypothetical protein